MLSIYAYTYDAAKSEFADEGKMLVKIGDTTRTVEERLAEQGDAAEWQEKRFVGKWEDVKRIKRDHDIHDILKSRGFHYTDGRGTEWFKIPATNVSEAFDYIDTIITDLEGERVRAELKLRSYQDELLQNAKTIIANGDHSAKLLALLCPRFGKTVWALELYRQLSEECGTEIMFLPCYWHGVFSSFEEDIKPFSNFNDMVFVGKGGTAKEINEILANGKKPVVALSLQNPNWTRWLKKVNATKAFMFVDEGDFGAHTEGQVKKVKKLVESFSMIGVWASGTGMERLASGTSDVDGVLIRSYSEVENEPGMVRRKFFQTNITPLASVVDAIEPDKQPNWTKFNGDPVKFKAFFTEFFRGLVGDNTEDSRLNIHQMSQEAGIVTGDLVRTVMMVTSVPTKEKMDRLAAIAETAIPEWEIVTLHGDNGVTNEKAAAITKRRIAIAKDTGKQGVLIITKDMGSRSYSVSQIETVVLAYDKGSIDATSQKASRCLTPGVLWNGTKKQFGMIVDASFDSNRSQIHDLLVEEASLIAQGQNITMPQAIQRYILNAVNVFQFQQFGAFVEVTENDLYDCLTSNEHLRSAAAGSMKANLNAEDFLDNNDDLTDELPKSSKSKKTKKVSAGSNAVNAVTIGGGAPKGRSSDERKKLLKWQAAIESLADSGMTVGYFVDHKFESYGDCIDAVAGDTKLADEFHMLYGIEPWVVQELIKRELLPMDLLNMIVVNTSNQNDSLF
jgi:hypothetical protein